MEPGSRLMTDSYEYTVSGAWLALPNRHHPGSSRLAAGLSRWEHGNIWIPGHVTHTARLSFLSHTTCMCRDSWQLWYIFFSCLPILCAMLARKVSYIHIYPSPCVVLSVLFCRRQVALACSSGVQGLDRVPRQAVTPSLNNIPAVLSPRVWAGIMVHYYCTTWPADTLISAN